jgi:hypothetical protein
MVSEKFKTWWLKYDDVEKCKYIKEFAVNTNNAHKKMVNATRREMEFGFFLQKTDAKVLLAPVRIINHKIKIE